MKPLLKYLNDNFPYFLLALSIQVLFFNKLRLAREYSFVLFLISVSGRRVFCGSGDSL